MKAPSARRKVSAVAEMAIVYSAFVLRAFTFILLLPVLTRFIEPISWGAVLVSQSLAMWLILLLDFGFSLSLVRKIAVDRDDPLKIRKAVGNVYSAKVLLLVPAALISFLIYQFGPLKKFPDFAFWAFLWAAIQGFNPLWYYQATEKLYQFSIVEAVGRVLYILLTGYFIIHGHNAVCVLVFQAITLLFVNVVTISRLWGEVSGFDMSLKGGIEALKESAMLSGFSLVTSVYTTASTLLFSLFAPAVVVPIYGNADRLIRSGISLLAPLNQLLLPKSSRAYADSTEAGNGLALKYLTYYSILGVLGYAVGWFVAPLAIRLLFGDKYPDTVTYFRYLLLLFPLTSINTVIVYHILIPRGLEGLITKIYIYLSFLALGLIILLVPWLSVMGMIIAMLSPEAMAILILLPIVMKRVVKHA